MNYIYDIYLNFNKLFYDFFDWNKTDEIMHIKKIPIIRISQNSFKTFICSNIKVNKSFLTTIYKKTEIWSVNKDLSYCCVFTDGLNTIAIQFNSNGNIIKKSSLYIDEESEVLETVNKLNITEIDYEVKNKEEAIFKTRKQLKQEEFINKELKKSGKNKLNYIYFECFGKKAKENNNILNNIKNISKESETYKNLYDILKLTSTSKK